MKKLLLTGIKAGIFYLACVSLLLCLLIPLWCGAGTYYVSQDGAGAKDGLSVETASAIATFNAGTAPFNALDDDTVSGVDGPAIYDV